MRITREVGSPFKEEIEITIPNDSEVYVKLSD